MVCEGAIDEPATNLRDQALEYMFIKLINTSDNLYT